LDGFVSAGNPSSRLRHSIAFPAPEWSCYQILVARRFLVRGRQILPFANLISFAGLPDSKTPFFNLAKQSKLPTSFDARHE